jgi:ribosomal protein S7
VTENKDALNTEQRKLNNMPRKVTKSLVRSVKPDRIYNSTAVAKLINRVMLDGKKQLSERLVYNGMQKAAKSAKSARSI